MINGDGNERGASGLTTFPQRLVRPIPAIAVLVAHLLHEDALPAAALEPGRAVTVGRCAGTRENTT